MARLSHQNPPSRKKLTLQPRHPIIPQPVLRQHAPDRTPEDLAAAPLLHHLLHRDLLQAARPRRVRVVLLLLHLLARRVQLRQPRRDHVVAAVCAGVVDRFVLAHERERDRGGQAAERARVAAGVDVVPGARVGEAGLDEGVLEGGFFWVGVAVGGGGVVVPCLRTGTLRRWSEPWRAQGLVTGGS